MFDESKYRFLKAENFEFEEVGQQQHRNMLTSYHEIHIQRNNIMNNLVCKVDVAMTTLSR